jgi:hypothetical protein
LFRVHTAQVAINLANPSKHIEWTTIASQLYSNLLKLNTAHYFNKWIYHKGMVQFVIAIFFLFVLFVIEAKVGDGKIEKVVLAKSKQTRWLIYILLMVSIVWFGIFNNTSFVYFQY